MLCIGLFRRPKADFGDEHFRIVITAPDKDMALQEDDIAFMLVQYEDKEDNESTENQEWRLGHQYY